MRRGECRGGSWESPGDLQFYLRNFLQDRVSLVRDGPGAQREGPIEDGGRAAEEGSEEPKSPGELPLLFLTPSCSSWSWEKHGAGTCLWVGVGCGRRLGFDPMGMHGRESQSLEGSGFPALFMGWAWPSVPHRYESGFVVLARNSHSSHTCLPFHLSPPWPLSPSWSEACFLGTDQVIDPEQQTKARTIFCFLTDL